MAIKNLEKMDIYNPTNYVNNSEPDIDADNLNKTENKLEETVAKANEIIDALKTLISTVQTNSDNTVPSSSLAYAMQQEITKNKEDIATANSNLEKYYTVSNTYANFSLQQNVEVQIPRRGILYGEFMSTSLGDFSFFKNDVAVFTSSVSNANVRIPFQPIHVEAGDRVRFTGVGITPTLTNMRLAQYTIQ